MRPPKYVKFENSPSPCCLVLNGTTKIKNRELTYYRVAGDWAVKVKIIENNVLQIDCKKHPQLHNKILIKCTKKEWLEDNRGYV